MSIITDPKNYIRVEAVDQQMSYDPRCVDCAYKHTAHESVNLRAQLQAANDNYKTFTDSTNEKFQKFCIDKQQELNREMARIRTKEECDEAIHKREWNLFTRKIWFWKIATFGLACLSLLLFLMVVL